MIYTNSHVHSPYSFSAFKSMNEMFDLAKKDAVKVLGINDFYSVGGYGEFRDLAQANKIYAMYNAEFLALEPNFQHSKTRINDPSNCGRMYIVGKGFHPDGFGDMDHRCRNLLKTAIDSQVAHTKKIIERVNEFYNSNLVSYEGIMKNGAKDFVGERHIAREIKRVYAVDNATEVDIRTKILKRGGPAYVEESEENFLTVTQCIEVIRSAKGIPCYPVLFDYGSNQFTEFESDLESMYKFLVKLGIKHLDIIPDRNSIENLKRLVEFFDKRGFYIMFGTEHNTHEMKRVRVTHKNGTELDQKLIDIAYKGCCSIAAWQAGLSEDDIECGDSVIKTYI